jgi:hypothetical protein
LEIAELIADWWIDDWGAAGKVGLGIEDWGAAWEAHRSPTANPQSQSAMRNPQSQSALRNRAMKSAIPNLQSAIGYLL